jgi:hypothetical protein
MIEHVSVSISDYKKSKQLYLEALKPLDYVLQSDYPSDVAGFLQGRIHQLLDRQKEEAAAADSCRAARPKQRRRASVPFRGPQGRRER